jgi:Fe-S cluster biogenesis protein NfuA
MKTLRLRTLVAVIFALAVSGCGSSDKTLTPAIMTAAEHSHYHIHAVDASHEHAHLDHDALGAHTHSHKHPHDDAHL